MSFEPEGFHQPRWRRRVDREWRMPLGEELERSLRAAEALLVQAEERYRHEQNRTFAIVSIITGTGLSLAAACAFLIQSFGNSAAAFLGSSLSLMIISAIFVLSVRAFINQRKRVRLDVSLELAGQIARLVNDALIEVSDRERWSDLQIKTFELRLSAFPLVDLPNDGRGRN